MGFISKLLSYISSIRYIPHLLVYRFSNYRTLLDYESEQWLNTHHLDKRGMRGMLLLLMSLPEYRSLFYFRTGHNWLRHLAKGQNNLEFYTASKDIGRGLIIWHGFSTVINVRSMGEDCQVWQNVVIGKKGSGLENDRPIIGNGVRVAANSVVVGEIELGNNVTVGAGAVVVKSIEDDCTVVGNPGRIVKRNS